MKNNMLKIIFNKSGKISSNIMAGLGVGVFAAVVGYSVYNAYNQSPAYNPAKRAIYTGEGQNLNLNSFDGSNLELGNTGSSSIGDGAGLYSSDGTFTDSKYNQAQADSEEAKFNAARSYLDSQKSGKTVVGTNGNIGSVAGADGEYQPFNSTYDAGEVSNTFAEKGAKEFGAKQFQGIQRQTSAAVTTGAKGIASQDAGAKGTRNTVNAGGNSRPATQINKLASSNGSGSSFGNGGGAKSSGSSAGGASGSGYGGSSRSVKDGQSRALPNNNKTANQGSESKAFQFGRGGTIGGFQAGIGAGGNEGGTRGGEKGGNAKDQLNTAYSFSTKGAATIQAGGDKALAQGATEAANAFDGGASVETGATIGDGQLMDIGTHNLGLKLSKADLGLNNINTEFETRAEKKERLFNSAGSHLIWALISTIVAMLAISLVLKTKNVYTYILAIVLALAAMYAIWLADYDGDGLNIFQTLSELGKLRKEDGQSNNAWLYYTAMGLMSAGVIASLIWGSELISKLPESVTKVLSKIFTPLGTNQIRKAANGVINSNNKK